ncbi:11691_t:CDS:1, partial [Acaulospora morrowiae]
MSHASCRLLPNLTLSTNADGCQIHINRYYGKGMCDLVNEEDVRTIEKSYDVTTTILGNKNIDAVGDFPQTM